MRRFEEIMNKPTVDTKALETWAKSQKRKAIRDRFDLDEEDADMCYLYLKSEHIVGSMGYVRGI